MGGVLSKIFRPVFRRVVIDLTKDDDEPPPRQQPLPEFTAFFQTKDTSARGTGITFGTPSLRSQASRPIAPLTAVDKAFNLTGSFPGSSINKPQERTGVNDVFGEKAATLTNVTSQAEASASSKPVFGSVTPLTAFTTPLDVPGKFQGYANPEPEDQTDVSNVCLRKVRNLAKVTSQDEQSPFAKLRPPQSKLPTRAEIIELISSDASPEPDNDGGATLPGRDLEPGEIFNPIWPHLPHRAQSKTTSLLRETTPTAPDERKTKRLITRAQKKAHEVLSRLGSEENPIRILQIPVPIPEPASAPFTTTQLRALLDAGPTFAPGATLVLFSDGSFLDHCWGGGGVAFWQDGHWTGKAFALGNIGGSYEAEARAICEAFKLAAALVRPHHRVVEVCSDHKGLVQCFQDIQRVHATDGLARKVIKMGKDLARTGVQVKMTWVKGHDVHAGNHMADHLARRGAEYSAQYNRSYDAALWEVDLSRETLQEFSTTSERSAESMLGTTGLRAAARKHRIAERRVERRALKHEVRSQRGAERYSLRSQDRAFP